MSAEANKRLVSRFVDEWLNARDRATLGEICYAGFEFHWGFLGDGRGVEALAEKENLVRAAFPDLRVEPAFTVADDRFVVNRSTVTGTHDGVFLGHPPTGRRATWSAVEIYRIEDGLIAEQWLNEDWALLLRVITPS